MNDQARWQRANPAAPEFLLENSPFYWLTRVSGRYLLQMERHLKAIGMDVPRWRVLMILAEDEPATITTLSERSVVKLATMTYPKRLETWKAWEEVSNAADKA